MAMSGEIVETQSSINSATGGGAWLQRTIYWSASKNQSDGMVTITCSYRMHFSENRNNHYFYALKGKCTFTINGVDYTIDTPATSTYATDFQTASVTSEPILLTEVDKINQISIKAKWNPDGSIGFFDSKVSVIPYRTSDYSMCQGTANIDPAFTSTEIALTGTEISEESIIDIKNYRTCKDATHTLTYKCKSVEETIFVDDSSDFLRFTLPESLAEKSTKSLILSITFTLTTHFPWGVSGTKTATVQYTIPDKEAFRPQCNISVTDGEHKNNVQYAEKFGAYIKGYSRFKVVVDPVPSYGSAITSITIKANGETYTQQKEIETQKIKNTGEQDVVVTLKDERGRSNEFIITKNVVDYNPPKVSKVNLLRVDAENKADSNGEYILVTFDAEITPLDNKNSANYKIRYETTAGLDQHTLEMDDFDGQYSVVNGKFRFSAIQGNAYVAVITAYDDLDEGFKDSGQNISTTLINFLASGMGLAFGTVAGFENTFENAFNFFPSGGFRFPEFTGSTLMTSRHIPNIYTVKNGNDIEKSPFEGEYTLIVLPGGGVDDFILIAITCDLEIKLNSYANSTWGGNWKSLTVS